MDISAFFKKSCIAFLLLILLACGNGDYDGNTRLPNISLSESSYDFGGIVLDNSSYRTFVITNIGSAPLTIGDISLPGDDFSVLADTCSDETLAVNGTCSLAVCFSPTTQTSFTGTLSIPSDDPDGTATIDLSGEGYGLNVWINKIEAVGCNVTVDVTVTNPRSSDVLNELEEGNFTLYENDIEISPPDITVDTIEYPSPISVVLAIDWSASLEDLRPTIKSAAKSFIDNLNEGVDEAAACKFNCEIDFDPADPLAFYIGDYSDLKDYIDSNFTGLAGTSLYDAVYDSITRAYYEGGNEKKAVVVLCDGVDEGDPGVPCSGHTLAEVISYANGKEIPVFTIYYIDPNYHPGEEYGNAEIMQQLAEGTGGEYFDGTSEGTDLTDVYQQISNVLSSKYTITYTSSNCAGDVSLDVQADYDYPDDDPDEGLLHGQDSGTITRP